MYICINNKYLEDSSLNSFSPLTIQVMHNTIIFNKNINWDTNGIIYINRGLDKIHFNKFITKLYNNNTYVM